ncbi:unnamed protein product [Echinostoma caproni]|uniref:BEACH domain-containing protein n=1 Tax=Echinostoma caproni TaxID=27848 RepID=A0A183AS09_9TREM|nr:unnamed protein product [Echinostoma caproni]
MFFTCYKGSAHVALRWESIDYALNNPRGKMLYQALVKHERELGRSTIPDETFFSILNHNPDVFPIPGAFTGVHEEHTAIPLARAKIWSDFNLPCGSGHWQRSICIFGLADLPYLFKQPHFFANKFLPNVEPWAYDLLELWYATKVHNETIYGHLSDSFNSSYYHASPYATAHL